MNLASGTNLLIGPRNGTLQSGASVIPGVIGTAFYTGTSGGYLDLGHNSATGCGRSPGDCPYGTSIAFWLKIYELPAPNSSVVMIDQGGCWPDSVGYCLFLEDDGLGFTARDDFLGFTEKIAILPLHQWYYVTVSYKDNHTAIYVNGCPAETIYSDQWERSVSVTRMPRLTFGSLGGGLNPAHVALDEVVIWHRALSAGYIWHLYVNDATQSSHD